MLLAPAGRRAHSRHAAPSRWQLNGVMRMNLQYEVHEGRCHRRSAILESKMRAWHMS